jgi:hypothetical protein
VTAAAGILSILVFAATLWRSGIVAVAAAASQTAGSALAALRDPLLDDVARERRMRAASLALFGAAASIALRSALVLVLAAAPVVLAHAAGLARYDEVVDYLLSWPVLIGATVVLAAAAAVVRRLRRR